MLADVVSKNGNLLLNIPVRGDGTIDDDEIKVLQELAAWMKVNSRAIFGTRPWRVFGEGSPAIYAGSLGERNARSYTSDDIRFTVKGNNLFAIGLVWPENGKLTIKTLAAGAEPAKLGKIRLLGTDAPVKYARTASGLEIELPEIKLENNPFVLEIPIGSSPE
jgi:alpha-L-fucosidase